MKVLVTTASKHGSTHEVGAVIAEAMRRAGLEVDERPPDEVGNLAAYEAVVLGSAVYMGRWMGSAVDFVERHEVSLGRLPVWLFSVGPLGDPAGPDPMKIEVEEILAVVEPREYCVFAGRLDRHDLGRVERFVTARIHAPEGDFRPWSEIADWGREIAAALVAQARATAELVEASSDRVAAASDQPQPVAG